ncbi:asparaginase domain-containing protein [Pseudomonas sp. RIT-To-2]|uniref:asparaginase domain-containing protein n=1 Tax=Pseudomonas sp. RIT-To-2 TaxID=3462541 RepID=UPI00241389BE
MGGQNLLNAAIVALSPDSRGRGVLVVMNDDIHGARWVRKTHALALDAFTSPGHGPLGGIVEGRPHFHHPASPRTPLSVPDHTDHRVALLEATLDGDTLLLDQIVPLGYAALVVNGFGAGHVPEPWAQRLGTLPSTCRYGWLRAPGGAPPPRLPMASPAVKWTCSGAVS